MIKVTEREDLNNLLGYPKAYDYISKLLENLLCEYSEYCADRSIRAFGAIYFMESLTDFENHKALGLEQSLTDTIIEWTNVQKGLCVMCVVISNDYAINIVCENDLYERYLENSR